MNFIDPSPLALTDPTKWLEKYKESFNLCPVGKSFMIDLNDVKITTLRPAVSKLSKELKKKFKVIEHSNCYEIYRKE